MKRIFLLFDILFFLNLWQTSLATISDTTKPDINAVRIDSPLTLSGKLDDPLWLKAMPVELKYEAMPGENTLARQKTFAMILYDQYYIYWFPLLR